MLLVVDIGNTNITFGVFQNSDILETFRIKSNLSKQKYEKFLQQISKEYTINACIISSVVKELTETIKSVSDTLFATNSIIFSSDIKTGLNIKTDNPSEVGTDRLVNAYGASVLYSKPAIVVDFGTATTFDIVDKKGDFVGGVIMPGIGLQLDVLSKNTSKLPKIEAKIANAAIGKNTADAILSGVIIGTASAVEGLIVQCEKELGYKTTVIFTGGYSKIILKYMTRKVDYIDPYLTLNGLRLLYELNKKG